MEAGTRDKLLKAALQEFNQKDFFSTDSNKIASEAGFAPATFYKHFKDKHEIFLEVYFRWYESQRQGVKKLVEELPPLVDFPKQLAEVILPNHIKNPGFRLSVSMLAKQDKRIQEFRVKNFEANMLLVNLVCTNYQLAIPTRASSFTFILQMERLCDAIALGDFERLQISEAEAYEELLTLFRKYFSAQ